MKCLIVDDSSTTRQILVHALNAIGFERVDVASNGDEALTLLDATTDLVITDWNMPGLNGLDLVRKLRAHAAHAQVPVLLVTSRSLSEDLDEATRAGVDAYLVKPFTPEMLRARIEEIFRLKADGEGPARKAA